MTFTDILESERVIRFNIEYNEADVQRLYARVDQCRNYMNDLNFKN